MSGHVVTFGCRLNAYESEVIRGHLDAAGANETVVVNTCAVTAEAERQARQAIRRLRRERPGARIVVTGCAAQLDPGAYAAMPEVDRVLGNREKLERASYDAGGAPIAAGDIMTANETAGHLVAGLDGRNRAVVQVQTGCDHRCTFCVIPYGRGNSRSVPLGEVIDQARALTGNGYRELVLSGVDLTSWGRDLPGRPTLGQAVRRLLAQVPALARVRLSSIDPAEIDPDLERLIATEPRLMPHLHLSVQAGDDLVLKRMKRRHSRADVISLCEKLRARRPGLVFGADLIAGFPTETEAMFANTLALVEDAGLTYLHVFPYSERPDTPAARMPAVPKSVRRERAARLRAAGEAAMARFLAAQVGGEARVLVEREGLGRSEQFAAVEFEPVLGRPGEIVNLQITAARADRLVGAAAV